MRQKRGLILIIAVSLIFLSTGLNFAQEQVASESAITENPAMPETQWVYGEVVNVDAQNKVLSVKYLDYETDTEKEMSVAVDDKTTYENVKSLDEIKPQDSVSIDYLVSPDSQNIANNISVEKPEGIESLPEEGTKAEPEAVTEAPPEINP